MSWVWVIVSAPMWIAAAWMAVAAMSTVLKIFDKGTTKEKRTDMANKVLMQLFVCTILAAIAARIMGA